MKKSIAIVYFLLIISTFFAQQFNFKNYTISQGLPQSSVYDIFQDSKGFIWFGTQGGIAKFNGVDFKTYSQKNKLAGNHVKVICEDNQTNIWTGHRFNGISCITSNNQISSIQPKELTTEIKGICPWENGVVAISSKNGIFQLCLKNDSIELINVVSIDTNRLTELHQIKTRGNQLFIATSNGLLILNKNFEIENKLFNGKLIADFSWDSKGDLIVLSKKEIVHINSNGIHKTTPLGNTYNRLAIAKNNNIYLSDFSNGALIIKDNKTFQLNTSNGLPTNQIFNLTFDNENNLWLGFSGFGASQLIAAKFKSFDKDFGLQSNQVQTVCMDSKEQLWVGTTSAVDIIKLNNNSFEKTIKKLNDFVTLDYKKIFHIIEDKNNLMWIATDNGVFIIDEKFRLFRHLTMENGISNDETRNISQDIEGNIWLVSLKNGITKITPSKDGDFTITPYFKKDGLCSDKFWTVYSSKSGPVYFGSNDGGITVYKDNAFSILDLNQGLTNLRAGSITEDSKGNIWIGTIGGGIFKYTGNEFHQFSSEDGLSADNPYLVQGDNFGKIWVGTNSGLDVIDCNSLPDKENRTNCFKHYGINEGFTGVETNQNAKFKDALGNLWFGTVKGVISCNPKEIANDTLIPKMHIVNKKLFLRDEITNNKHVFNYKENYISFEFIGLHFVNPHQVYYSYKLENFDTEWSPWDKRNNAIYSNLAPGAYSFQLKGANGDFYESPIISYEFKIVPPYWKTTWFTILTSLLGLLFVFLFFRFRSIKIKRDRDLLSKEVENRTSDLNKEKLRVTHQKEIIEQKNKNITDSINYAKKIQDSVLPNPKNLNDFFSASFIYYNPRDIVSGDFYWFKQKANKLIIASADCTGHGIPGAFLSMLGSELLNQIVLDPKVHSPAQALDLLDKGIYDSINRSGESFQKDGIDISICAFNSNEDNFKYSGARRPILIWDGKALHSHDPIPCSVGEMQIRGVKAHEIEIPIKKGDRIYMFSDGYIDQFGGKKNKKYLIRRFRELIISLANTPMKDQKAIFHENFKSWKHKEEQIDDVLVIGVEI